MFQGDLNRLPTAHTGMVTTLLNPLPLLNEPHLELPPDHLQGILLSTWSRRVSCHLLEGVRGEYHLVHRYLQHLG
jgi:hypothetical protein